LAFWDNQGYKCFYWTIYLIVCIFIFHLLSEICQCSSLMRMVSESESRDWSPSQPLHEDVHLQEFQPLSDLQRDIVFDVHNRLDLSKKQEVQGKPSTCSVKPVIRDTCLLKPVINTYQALIRYPIWLPVAILIKSF
jgi:hypothetical protein